MGTREVPTGYDVWQLRGLELFIRYRAGAGNANPSMPKVRRLLGVPGTARNLATVQKLVELTRACSS